MVFLNKLQKKLYTKLQQNYLLRLKQLRDLHNEKTREYKFKFKRYKIQEVIKPNQVILVQVIKDERGQKGAALSTFISIAGKYIVLMPNTPKGGGISRKIFNPADRKKIRTILNEIQIPKEMGLIVRTAGSNKTKNEISHDLTTLMIQDLKDWFKKPYEGEGKRQVESYIKSRRKIGRAHV